MDFLGIGLQGLTSGLNASNSSSSSQSIEHSENVGGSQSSSWNNQWGDSWSMGQSSAESTAEQHADSESSSTTFGREASAEDIKRAQEANQIQRQLWEEQAKYNASEAEKDRAFQAYMSNTSYQRAVKDLLAAGVNPILAAGNMGASTPGGAMASSGLATAQKATTYAQSESRSKSHSEGSSSSKSQSSNASGSHSEGHGGSQSSSYSSGFSDGQSSAQSKTETQAKSLISALGDLLGGSTSAEKESNTTGKPRNGVSNWRPWAK